MNEATPFVLMKKRQLYLSQGKKAYKKLPRLSPDDFDRLQISSKKLFSLSSKEKNPKKLNQQGFERHQKREYIDSFSRNTQDNTNNNAQEFEANYISDMDSAQIMLISKLSKQIELIKDMKYGRIFSNRKLRNKIRLASILQNPCDILMAKKRALSPCNKDIGLSLKNSFSSAKFDENRN